MRKLMKGVRSVAFALCALPFAAVAEGDPDLPAGFARLDWIQGNGAAYIKTAYRPTCTDKVELKITFVQSKSGSKTQTLWCSRGASTSANTFTAFILTGTSIRFDRNSDTSSCDNTLTLTEGTEYTVVADYNTLQTSINGDPTKNMAAGDYTPGSVLYLFASHTNGNSLNNYAYYKFHYLKVWDKDGNLIHHFVPVCQNMLPMEDMKRYGVFDLVDWAYAPNANSSSTFTPSEEVPQRDNKALAYWKFDSENPFADEMFVYPLSEDASGFGDNVIGDGMFRLNQNAKTIASTANMVFPNGGKTATFEAFVRRRPNGLSSELATFLGTNFQSPYNGSLLRAFSLTRYGVVQADWLIASGWNSHKYVSSPMGVISDTKWHHVAVTIDLTESFKSEIFVDGVSVVAVEEALPTSATFQKLVSTDDKIYIGGSSYRGDIASVRVSGAVLSPAEFLKAPALAGEPTEGKTVWAGDSTVLSPGAQVIIPAGTNVTLTSSTPRLQSLTVDGSLTVEGWETKINADQVIVRKGGLVSAKGPFYGSDPSLSNRVWITCGTLNIEAGGEINAAERGFAGVIPEAYRDALGIPSGTVRLHPGTYSGEGGLKGSGNGLPPSHGGAGCFGYGTDANANWSMLSVYGSAEWPTTPGTGGASNRFQWEPTHGGGQGGGVVTIEATGAVMVNGRITVDGESLPEWTNATFSGNVLPGAGGSILISCTTISGSGLITANGGDTENNVLNSKCAGGGRIAIHYNTAVQIPAAAKNLILSAEGGCPYGQRGGGADNDSRMHQHGQAGTIWLSDGSWVSLETINHFRGRLINVGALDFYGDLTLDQWVGLGDNGSSLRVRGNLTLTNASARLDIGAADTYTGWAARYGYLTTIPNQLIVDGNLTLTEGARLDVHAAATNGTDSTEGALVSVGGDLTIGTSAKLYPMASPIDGGSVLITAKNIVIDETAVVGLAGAGFTGGNNGDGKGPGYGSISIGAGYGGPGGRADAGVTYGQTYGDAVRPMWPGSGGGSGWNTDAGSGGGFIHLVASKSMMVNGTICADGIAAGGNSNGGSGGSGGGIFLETLGLEIGPTARMTANGGAAMSVVPPAGRYSSGGGGGRISIWSGKDLWNPEMRPNRYTVSAVVPDEWASAFSVAGGAKTVDDERHFAGEDGTIRFVTVRGVPGLMLLLK